MFMPEIRSQKEVYHEAKKEGIRPLRRRDAMAREFGRPLATDELIASRKARREGAEAWPLAQEEYKEFLRDKIEREGIGSVNLAEAMCEIEYLHGKVNANFREQNIDYFREAGRKYDDMSEVDDMRLLHGLIQEAQPQYQDNQVTLDQLVNEKVSNCYTMAQAIVAIRSCSQRLADIPLKLQW